MCSEPDEIVGSGWFTKRLGIQIGARYQPEGLHIHQEYAEDGKAAQDVEQPDPGVLLRSCCRLSRYRRLHCISPLLWFSPHGQGTGMRCGKFRRPHEAHTRERPWTKAPMTGNGAQTFRLDAAIEDRSGESAMTSKKLEQIASDGADFHDFRDVVPQHVLDPHLQRRRRRGASGAGALHPQVHHAALEPLKDDVAPILRHRRTHAGVEEFLDLRRHLVSFTMLRVARVRLALQQRLSGDKVLHDYAEDARLEQKPLALIVLADRDESVTEENPGYAVDLEQPPRERRALGFFLRRKAGSAFRHHRAAGQELESRRVRRLLGLNEHQGAPVVLPVTS